MSRPDERATSPISTSTPFREAYERALAEHIPQAVPLRFFADDRGWSLMNLFTGVLEGGQCNYSLLYPGVFKAWHRHQRQTDFWVVLHGMAKLGVFDENRRDEPGYRGHTFVSGEKNPQVLIIPPPLWHGLTCVGSQPCGLLYYVTQVYDPRSPDEDRIPHDSFPTFRWDVEHK